MSIDPTRIDLAWDPRSERLSGVAIHGDTPFDVPFISQITENLWTGGCTNGLILPYEIKHLVSLYPWEEYRVQHDLRTRLAVRAYDAHEIDEEQITAVADWVNICRKTGPVLVHCQAGLNRSNLVAGLALIRSGMPPADAIALLREKRSPAVLCNTYFEDWLLQAA